MFETESCEPPKPTLRPRDLPRLPSALLRAAVEDARMIEIEGRVLGIPIGLDMGVWALFDSDSERCDVCMAGAMLVGHGIISPMETLDYLYERLEPQQVVAVRFINHMREPHRNSLDFTIQEIDSLTMGINPYPDHKVWEPALREATFLIQKNFDIRMGRAPWDTYLRAADILATGGI